MDNSKHNFVWPQTFNSFGGNIDMTVCMFNFERCKVIGSLSGSKGPCYQTWWPEFDSRDPHDRRKERIPRKIVPKWLYHISTPLEMCEVPVAAYLDLHWDLEIVNMVALDGCVLMSHCSYFSGLCLYFYYHCHHFAVLSLVGHEALLCIPGCH